MLYTHADLPVGPNPYKPGTAKNAPTPDLSTVRYSEHHRPINLYAIWHFYYNIWSEPKPRRCFFDLEEYLTQVAPPGLRYPPFETTRLLFHHPTGNIFPHSLRPNHLIAINL